MQQILINFLKWIITTLSSIFITPVVSLLTAAIPDLQIALSAISNFIVNYALPYINFAKEVFLNISCLPRSLFTLLVSYLLFKISLHAGIQIYKLIVKIWNLVKP